MLLAENSVICLAKSRFIVYPCQIASPVGTALFSHLGKQKGILNGRFECCRQHKWCGHWLVRNQELLLSYAVNIVAAIAIVIIGMIVARIVSNTVNRLMVARKIDATVADFLSALVRYGIIAFTLIAALGRVGVQTASVIAVLGAAGLAVGLALQGSLSNLAAGVLLVMFRPFRAGEYVDLGGVAGTVLNVQIFSTTMRTVDGKIVVIPNGKIIAGNIINFSREPVRRNEFIIGVAYDSDIDQVKNPHRYHSV